MDCAHRKRGHGREENIALALAVNVAFTVLELVGGLLTNSLAILSDALHDFGDTVALSAALVAERKARKKPDARRTFGYQRLSLFASLFAALVLVAGSLWILSKAVPRLLEPEHVNAPGMTALAVLGVAVNGAAFLRLKRGASLDERVLSWHMLEDVLGWAVILVGAILIQVWDNHLIDPLLTVGFTVFILWGVARNIREAGNILLQGVPAHIDPSRVKAALLAVEGVQGVHDMHIWSLEGETDVFTAHVVVDEARLKAPDETRKRLKEVLKNHHIEHSTFELESACYCSGIECRPTDG